MWIIRVWVLACLVRKRTYITGQSIGLFSSLVTWCDHGREAAFSLWLLTLLCVLHLPKKHQSGHFINTDEKKDSFKHKNPTFRFYTIREGCFRGEKDVYSHHWWSSGPETLLLSPVWSPCLSTMSAAVRTQTETERPVCNMENIR